VGGAFCTTGKTRNTYKNLVAKPEGNGSLGRSRYWWEGNIKTELKEIGWNSVEWIHVARNQWRAFVNTVMNLQGLEFLDNLRDS
jgi:hypothetical protein